MECFAFTFLALKITCGWMQVRFFHLIRMINSRCQARINIWTGNLSKVRNKFLFNFVVVGNLRILIEAN